MKPSPLAAGWGAGWGQTYLLQQKVGLTPSSLPNLGYDDVGRTNQ